MHEDDLHNVDESEEDTALLLQDARINHQTILIGEYYVVVHTGIETRQQDRSVVTVVLVTHQGSVEPTISDVIIAISLDILPDYLIPLEMIDTINLKCMSTILLLAILIITMLSMKLIM